MKPARAVPPTNAQRIADALVHFEIGLRTHSAHLPVDWSYVAYRMAVALGEDEWDREPGAEVIELGPATRHVLRRKGAS
jgi:hypothetical protein